MIKLLLTVFLFLFLNACDKEEINQNKQSISRKKEDHLINEEESLNDEQRAMINAVEQAHELDQEQNN